MWGDNMKTAKRTTIAVLILSMLLFTVSCFSTRKDRELALEYMSQFEHNENIVHKFIDGLYYNGEIILETNELSSQPMKILFATNEFFYYRKKENGFFNVYKSDYDLQSNEMIFSTVKLDGDIAMKNEETIVYYNRVDELCGSKEYVYEYNISTKKQAFVDEEFWEYVNYNDKYSCEKSKITNKETNETKTIKTKDILEVEQAKVLDDYLGIEIRSIRLRQDKIYVQCRSCDNFGFNSIITTYLYDFETEEYTFVDWVYTIDDAESYSVYFF